MILLFARPEWEGCGQNDLIPILLLQCSNL